MVHFVIVGILTLVSTFGLYTILTTDGVLPIAASAQAGPIDELFGYHFLVIAFFYSLVVIFMFYSLVVFRQKKGETEYGEHFEGNTQLEIAWIIFPLIVVIIFGFLGANALGEVERPDSDAMEVIVYAKQWSWSFEYPEAEIETTQLVIPVGRQILLRMTSEDVIHSFWVPEFRVKQDILPGGEDFIKELRINPTLIGTYVIRCAELCGTGHYQMREIVDVRSASDFEAWVEEMSGCESPVECGAQIAGINGCVACHASTADSTSTIGPSWLGMFGSTITLEDGTELTADVAYIIESILDPDAKIHEGFPASVMPATFSEKLSQEEIDQLIAFIESLQ